MPEGFEPDIDDNVDSDNVSMEANNDSADNEHSASDTGEDSGPKINPAWNLMLEKLPAAYQREIIPSLQEWDKNYQSRDEQFAPYRKFVDDKVDPVALENALGLANALRNDPRSVFTALHEKFNFGYDLFPAGDNPNGETDEEDENLSEDSEEENPVIQELRSQMSALTEREAERQQEAIQREAEEAIQNQLNSVETRLGRELTETEFNMVVSIANGMDEIDLEKAAEQMFNAGYLKARSAPETHGSNGVPAPPAIKLGTKEDDGNILALMKSFGLAE